MPRLYYLGAGGTVYYRNAPDSPGQSAVQVAFYEIYNVNPQAYNASIKINTPLTSDASGNIYFGFLVSKNNLLWPLHDAGGKVLTSGIARIDLNGNGTWISVSSTSNSTPRLLMLSVLPDPRRSTRPLFSILYWSSKLIGYRAFARWSAPC